MKANTAAMPAWKRLLSKRVREAVQACATPADVRLLGEQHFLHMPGLSAFDVGAIGTTIGGWGGDPQPAGCCHPPGLSVRRDSYFASASAYSPRI
jgi:hypothetical protein